MDSVTQLVDKDATEYPDGNGLRNVGLGCQAGGIRSKVFVSQGCLDVIVDEGNFVSQGNACHAGSYTHYDVSPKGPGGDADDPDLKTERYQDNGGDGKIENVCGDLGGEVGSRDA